MLIRAGELALAGKPHVLASVVRVTPPASTKRGDRALVTPEGVIVGWVGGACSEPIVIREALRALATGKPQLLRIGPSGTAESAPPDVVAAESACASEGTVEVLLEPSVARLLLVVVGESPAAHTLAALARTIGWRVSDRLVEDADAVVVATMGHGDERTLEAALAFGADYVGLVASSRRASTVLASLRRRGVGEEALARIRSPAGLDLGPSSQEEIAVAILAELVAWRHLRAPETAGEIAAQPAGEAVDRVCGMIVSTLGNRETISYDGVAYWFCCSGCRERFEADPTRYLGAAAS